MNQFVKIVIIASIIFLLLFNFMFFGNLKRYLLKSTIIHKLKHNIKNFENESCDSPKRDILYMKTQKTGSTTWKVMFIQYAEKYQLNLCMDSTDIWHVNWPYQVDVDKLTKHYQEKCDMIADEMVYNQKIFRKLMNPHSFVITSVRHPLQHFLSMYKYARIHEVMEEMANQKLSLFQGIELYLKHYELVRNFWSSKDENFLKLKPVALLKRNLQIYTMGLNSDEPNEEEILTMVNKIHHFIITDFSTESLVLLHKKICCSMNDLYYTMHNVGRSNQEKKAGQNNVPQHIVDAILKFNDGDFILYQYAQKRLLREIQNYPNFKADKEKYNEGLKKYQKSCPTTKGCLKQSTQYFTYAVNKRKQYLSEKLRKEFQQKADL